MSKTTKKALGLLAIIFGVLILVKPELLTYLIALYLIVVGVSNLFS